MTVPADVWLTVKMGISRKIEKPRKAKNSVKQSENVQNKIIYNPRSTKKMPFLCLNDDVLLKVFSYLTPMDSINLAMTCVRLQQLSYCVLKTLEFHLCENYSYDLRKKQKQILNKKHIMRIGPCIHKLTIDLCEIDKTVMDNCINVRSLRIYSDDSNVLSLQRVRECNKWIKQLNLDSLWLIYVKYTNELIDEVSNLKELRIDANTKYLKNLLVRNSTVECLSITAVRTFSFSICRKLQHLRCLHITIDERDLVKLIKFGKFDEVTELSVCFWYSRPWLRQDPVQLDALNSFLESLARYTKLAKLNLMLPWHLLPNRNTFRALKSLNLNALGLHCEDVPWSPLSPSSDEFTRFIREFPRPCTKHLTLSHCSIEQFKLLVEKWRNVVTICVRYTDPQTFLNDVFLKEILSISNNRPTLTLHVMLFPGIQIQVRKSHSVCLIRRFFLHAERQLK